MDHHHPFVREDTMETENEKSGHRVDEPTADEPTPSPSNTEPAEADDSGVGIGDQEIERGDEESGDELKEKLERGPEV
jgi:hypothetical protein